MFMKISLRLRLMLSFLSVIVVAGVISTAVGVHLIGDRIVKQAQDKVKLDLNSARTVYRDKIKEVSTAIRLTSMRFFLRNAILNNDIERIEIEIKEIRKIESLDILNLTDNKGKVIVRASNPKVYGDIIEDELIKEVILKNEAVASTDIIRREKLLKEGEDIAEQARIEFIPTPKAKMRTENRETSGMVIKAAAPVLDNNGKLIGILYGGNLLNRNYEIVDKIKDIVYRGETYKGKDIGTATIFQSDLRISTNVKTKDGSRAIGTRVSEEVNNQVLVKGEPWIGRAFVVNDWYITAYEPIRNIKDEIIGILYVGILEEKFVDLKGRTLLIFLAITISGIFVATAISNILANSITKPVRRLVSAADNLAKGNFSHRVEGSVPKDEIGELGKAFNYMTDAIKERDNKLKENVEQELMKSERLAIIGQLAAGVAHEINNPLGSILIYSHLLLEDLEKDDSKRGNLEKIVDLTTRCKDIVKGLLDFSRQTEPEMRISNVNRIIEDVLSLVGRQSIFHNIEIIKKLSENIPQTMLDDAQIQQVFMNIVFNSAEAMNGQGKIIIETLYRENFIEVKFTDTGCGIPEKNMKKLFEPFFSTKKEGYGVGLGLSISYGIIKKHNGEIIVESDVGEGSTFTVRLPVKEIND